MTLPDSFLPRIAFTLRASRVAALPPLTQAAAQAGWVERLSGQFRFLVRCYLHKVLDTILFTAILQVSIVKLVQKQGNRLKGDPTKTSFNKEFLDSMNEAEQLKVFKSGYRALQTTKSITLMIVVFTIFMNILFETGGFAVFISCLFMLVQTVSFGYYEKNTV